MQKRDRELTHHFTIHAGGLVNQADQLVMELTKIQQNKIQQNNAENLSQ